MGSAITTLLAAGSVLTLAGYAMLSLSAGGVGISSAPGAAIQTAARESRAADTRNGKPDQDKVPLDIPLPKPQFTGTPPEFELTENIEPLSEKPRPVFLAPSGVCNVAYGRKVILSDKNPTAGEAGMVTDGDKEATDASYVQMHRGLQWAQVDLGGKTEIFAIVVWHSHTAQQVYHDVVVQVSDNPDFVEGVQTVYHNDYDNSSGLGIGTDKEYFETFEGRLIDAKGISGRYVRCYSKGSTYSALNRYTEVEVYGFPVAMK
jgi:hypothetical protein